MWGHSPPHWLEVSTNLLARFPSEGDAGSGDAAADPPRTMVQLGRDLTVTADYRLHISSTSRKVSLAFLQPTPCLISILPPFSLLSFSLNLSIPPPCGNLGSPISPQATVNVWHGGTGSQSPQKAVMSMLDAWSEIIRGFIIVRERDSFLTCIAKCSFNHIELERFNYPKTQDSMFSQTLSSFLKCDTPFFFYLRSLSKCQTGWKSPDRSFTISFSRLHCEGKKK